MSRRLAMLMWALAPLTTAADPELSIRGGISGNWTDPVENRQGVQIEVVDDRRAVVAWFTYDDFGAPTWLFGTGDIDGDTIRAELRRFDGGAFPPGDSDPAAIVGETWGEVELRFDGCNRGEMRWQPTQAGFEPGRMDIRRITAIEGAACGSAERFERELRFRFDAGRGRWRALFADFNEPQRDLIESEFGWRMLPTPLADRDGLVIGGTNRSDDLAMLLTAPIGGLEPDAEYRLELQMTVATNVPDNCVGVGGAPGESVYLQLGATPTRPEVVETDGRYSVNFGKAQQSSDGEEALIVGDLTNGQDCGRVGDAQGEWRLKTVSTAGRDFTARSDDQGRLWLVGGSESGFEARSMYYVTEFVARLQGLGDGG
jgi:hypothetical protein